MAESFPRQEARTRRFTLGRPRNITVSVDGSRVAFLRSAAGDDPDNALWVLDLDGAEGERLVASPSMLPADDGDLPQEERSRRERVREIGGGIVAYAADPHLGVAAFAAGGRPFLADLSSGEIRSVSAPGPVVDPRPDPTGRRVAYVYGGALFVEGERVISEDGVTWGLADFIAAEEMGRTHGFWWAPDGEHLLVARVDESPVQQWTLADPANPSTRARTLRYPAAGTANADVRLAIVGLGGDRVDVEWDHNAFPYMADAGWQVGHAPLLTVQTRDQRCLRVLAVDPDDGSTEVLREETDDAWIDLVPGVPRWTTSGALVTVADTRSSRRLMLADQAVTPPTFFVRGVVSVDDDVVFTASVEPTETHVWRATPGRPLQPLTDAPGWHTAVAGGDTVVIQSASMQADGVVTTVHRDGRRVATITSYAETPVVRPHVTFLRAGERELSTALLLPAGPEPDHLLPVLLDPYGGPHAQRVIRARNAFLESQWFADQGFAVVVADGRGTPGRGPEWERAVHGDLAGPPLDDQVDALLGVASQHRGLDLSKVAIRGWSFGGYLAALAVLRRPDVFHAAIAGAPVTDWRLYDTHYTERYLGHPDEQPDAYDRSSLLADAHRLERPLLMIHGMADDNVVAAHTLRLSQALLEAGRPHNVLPLSGVTHMTPQEVVAENLLLLQLAFLRDALDLPTANPVNSRQ